MHFLNPNAVGTEGFRDLGNIWETFVKNEAFELVGFVGILIGTYGANEHFRQEENTQKEKYNVHAGEYGYLTWAEARGK